MEVNKMRTKHIAMGAIFTSLILVLLVLGYVVPGIELLFMIFLPFLSSYISFEFGLKKSLPFLVASIILSFLLSYINAILYVIPSLVSGVCFGALGKRINKIIDLTFIMSFIEGFLFALSIIAISLLFGLDIQEDIASLINMDSNRLNSNIYLFLNGELITSDQVESLSAARGSTLELCIVQAKNELGFSEDAIMKWKTVSSNLLSISNALDSYKSRYNEKTIEYFSFILQILNKIKIKATKNPTCNPETARTCEIPAYEKDSLTPSSRPLF